MDLDKAAQHFQLETTERFDDVFRAAVLQTFTNIVLDTPVDQGHLRNNWVCSFGSADTATQRPAQASGAASIGSITVTLNSSTPLFGGSFFLSNNLPYAKRIEYGYSKVKAPRGMVRINLAKFSQFLKGVSS